MSSLLHSRKAKICRFTKSIGIGDTQDWGHIEHFIVTRHFYDHISVMKTKMTRVKKKRQLNYVSKLRITRDDKNDGGRDGEFTEPEGEEEELK